VNDVNSGFVFTGREQWGSEHKSVPIIPGSVRLMNIRTRFVGDPLLDEFVIDIQLDLNAPVRIVVVDSPSGNSLRVSVV
jgi:hypothetical protein